MAEGMFYNVTGGYVEGIVRGYRNTLLTGQNYGNLTQCETIDGMFGSHGGRPAGRSREEGLEGYGADTCDA